MLGLFWTAVIGLIVGGLARLIMPGKDEMGWFMTSVLGVAGAVLITLVGRFLGLVEPGSGVGFVWSVVGAVIVLLIYRRMKTAGKT